MTEKHIFFNCLEIDSTYVHASACKQEGTVAEFTYPNTGNVVKQEIEILNNTFLHPLSTEPLIQFMAVYILII